jgi:hypothetical protein
MKLSQIYTIMGWPLRFWRTKTLPPVHPEHNIPFNDAMRMAHHQDVPGNSKQSMTGQEFTELIAAIDARYESLKQGEALGKLSADESRELRAMETGAGWCLDLFPQMPERSGRRSVIFP